ncbi:MAG TPA: hypothetical protein VIR59_04390 [Gaiellaceae bacterium]
MTPNTPKVCRLHVAARGCAESCPGDRCAFWEPGGAVLGGSCVLERLAVDLERPGLADYLLSVRERIEGARERNEAEAAHREFARRLGSDV